MSTPITKMNTTTIETLDVLRDVVLHHAKYNSLPHAMVLAIRSVIERLENEETNVQ